MIMQLYVLLHVTTGTYLNQDILLVIVGYGVYRSLNGLEVTGAVKIHIDSKVTRRSDPLLFRPCYVKICCSACCLQ